MSKGFVPLFREASSSWWWDNANQMRVMMDIIMHTAYSKHTITRGGKKIVVNIGEEAISIRKHAKRCKLKKWTYETVIEITKKHGDVEICNRHGERFVKLIKADVYISKEIQPQTGNRQSNQALTAKDKRLKEQKNKHHRHIYNKNNKTLKDTKDSKVLKQSVYKTTEEKVKVADNQQNLKDKNTDFENKEIAFVEIYNYYPGKKDIEKVRKEFNNRIHTEGDFFDLCVTTEIYLEACSRRKSKPTSLRQFLIEWRDHQANTPKEISDWDIAQIKGEAELYYQFIANLQVKKGKKTLGIPFVCKSGSAPEKIIFEFKDPETLKFIKNMEDMRNIGAHKGTA